jgi:hypothetical protein
MDHCVIPPLSGIRSVLVYSERRCKVRVCLGYIPVLAACLANAVCSALFKRLSKDVTDISSFFRCKFASLSDLLVRGEERYNEKNKRNRFPHHEIR